jgi:hypothetical protein
MTLLRALNIAIIAFLLFGCASSGMSPEERSALNRVSIASFGMPEKPTIITSGTGTAFALTGAVGVAIASGASDLPTAYKQTLAQNRIDIPAYIRAELKSQLKAKGIEVVDNASQADAVLSVQVTDYGLTGGMFSDKRLPLWWANFALTKRDGRVIWKNTDGVRISFDVLKKIEGRPIPEYFNDPKMHENTIRQVTQMIVASVASTL